MNSQASHRKMHRCATAILLFAALAMSGCSYITDFALVNESNAPVYIIYKVKAHPGPFSPPTPATVSLSEFGTKHNQWRKLNANDFQTDEGNRTVSFELAGGQAVRVATMHHYVEEDDEHDFPIEEIWMMGSNGQTQLIGEQARRGFEKVSRTLYTLSYK